MESKTIINAVVATILIMAVATPLIMSMTDDVHSTEYNEGYSYFASNAVSEAVTFSFASETEITRNGEILEDLTPGNLEPLVMTNESLLTFLTGEIPLRLWFNDSTVVVKTITYNPDGTYTYVTNTDTTGSGTYTSIASIDPKGDYVAIKGEQQVGLNNSETAYIYLRLPTGGNILFTGSYTDGVGTNILNYVGTNTASYTISPEVVSSDDYSSRLIFSQSADVSGTDRNGELYVFVPYQYDMLTEMDDVTKTLLSLAPVILVVGLILSVVATSIIRRG